MPEATSDPADQGGHMRPDEPPGPRRDDAAAGGHGAAERGPIGTLFVLLLYLMALVGMWGTLYWILLSR
ncbi:MAG TPA: hypothetical protein VKA44_01545 [Gemmatimonadota bacterium]|nr:hypothetical protein [Gemmatimonadota bacterium]